MNQNEQELNHLIDRHLAILEEIKKSTKLIIDHAVISDVNSLTLEVDNRERVCNILEFIQGKVENKLAKTEDHSEAMKEKLKSWNFQFQSFVKEISTYDEMITRLLEEDKEKITKEVAKVFNNKNAIKGYNLKDVSK